MNEIDLGRALKTPYEDKDWIVKSLIATLWTVLFVTSPAVMGAIIEYTRNVAHGYETLPEWNDFGGKWLKGIQAIIAGFIYFLPALLLSGLSFIPLAADLAAGNESPGFFAASGLCLLNLLAVVYSIAMSLFYYAALTNFAIKGEFGAFFEIGEIWDRVRATPRYWSAWLFALLVGLIYGIVGAVLGWIPFVGWLLAPAASFLGGMSIAHLFGQWAREAYRIVPYAPMPQAPPQPPYPPAPPYPPSPRQAPGYPPPPVPPSRPAPQPPVPGPQPPAAPPQPRPPATPPPQAPEFRPPAAPPPSQPYGAVPPSPGPPAPRADWPTASPSQQQPPVVTPPAQPKPEPPAAPDAGAASDDTPPSDGT